MTDANPDLLPPALNKHKQIESLRCNLHSQFHTIQGFMKTILRTVPFIILILMGSCLGKKSPQVMTVTGPIPPAEMGITLVHEHILVDFIGADSTGYHRWDRQEVIEKALPCLEEVRSLGLSTFADATPAWLGRDPELLRMLAGKTGLNILTNTGLYGAFNNKYVSARAFGMSAKELSAEWIAEFRNGIEGTGIRPGFIKIAVDRSDTLSAMHEKIVRAAGLTHLETGLVIMSHTGPDGPAFSQLAILKEMGVPPDAFIWTHAQAGTTKGRIKAAGIGAWISLDNINHGQLDAYLGYLQEMKSAGLLNRVLISHDSGWYSAGEEGGGNFRGYTVIFKEFIPFLRQNGFSESDINLLLVKNPAQALTIHSMKSSNP
jgi:phosphotriesterase-related protein